MAQTPELVQQSTEAVPETPPLRPFDSNPFTLSFNALGRLFDTNVEWAIAILILSFIGGGVQFLGSLPSEISASRSSPTQANQLSSTTQEQFAGLLFIVGIVSLIVVIVLLIGFVIQTFISGMFAYVALQSEKGKKAGFGEAAQATAERFWRLLLARGLANIKIFLWSLLLIIPGIIASLRYKLLVYTIMDEPASNKGVIASHDRVKTIVKGRLFEVLGLMFATSIVPIISSLLELSGGAAQYRQLQATLGAQRPKVHWLNYLLFVIMLIFVSLILLVVITAIALYGIKR